MQTSALNLRLYEISAKNGLNIRTIAVACEFVHLQLLTLYINLS